MPEDKSRSYAMRFMCNCQSTVCLCVPVDLLAYACLWPGKENTLTRGDSVSILCMLFYLSCAWHISESHDTCLNACLVWLKIWHVALSGRENARIPCLICFGSWKFICIGLNPVFSSCCQQAYFRSQDQEVTFHGRKLAANRSLFN